MFEFVKKFLTDETAFVGLVRAAAIGAGGLVTSGAVPGLEASPWGAALMALGGFIRAGDKNK